MSFATKKDSDSIPLPNNRFVREFRRRMIKWGSEYYVHFPWRDTPNKFHALIAEIMLQRTNADQVEPVYRKFVAEYPTVTDAFQDSRERIFQLLWPLGLHWRIEKIFELIQELHKLGGAIPTNIERLQKLPGVGIYVASAFLSLHLGQRFPIVDSNVVRLYGRVLGFPTTNATRRKKDFLKLADIMTPLRKFREFNYAIIDHTRAICKKKPLCPRCPVADMCDYGLKTLSLVYN